MVLPALASGIGRLGLEKLIEREAKKEGKGILRKAAKVADKGMKVEDRLGGVVNKDKIKEYAVKNAIDEDDVAKSGGLLGTIGRYWAKYEKRKDLWDEFKAEKNYDMKASDSLVAYNIWRYGKKTDRKPKGLDYVMYLPFAAVFKLMYAPVDQHLNKIGNMFSGKDKEPLPNPAQSFK